MKSNQNIKEIWDSLYNWQRKTPDEARGKKLEDAGDSLFAVAVASVFSLVCCLQPQAKRSLSAANLQRSDPPTSTHWSMLK